MDELEDQWGGERTGHMSSRGYNGVGQQGNYALRGAGASDPAERRDPPTTGGHVPHSQSSQQVQVEIAKRKAEDRAEYEGKYEILNENNAKHNVFADYLTDPNWSGVGSAPTERQAMLHRHHFGAGHSAGAANAESGITRQQQQRIFESDAYGNQMLMETANAMSSGQMKRLGITLKRGAPWGHMSTVNRSTGQQYTRIQSEGSAMSVMPPQPPPGVVAGVTELIAAGQWLTPGRCSHTQAAIQTKLHFTFADPSQGHTKEEIRLYEGENGRHKRVKVWKSNILATPRRLAPGSRVNRRITRQDHADPGTLEAERAQRKAMEDKEEREFQHMVFLERVVVDPWYTLYCQLVETRGKHGPTKELLGAMFAPLTALQAYVRCGVNRGLAWTMDTIDEFTSLNDRQAMEQMRRPGHDGKMSATFTAKDAYLNRGVYGGIDETQEHYNHKDEESASEAESEYESDYEFVSEDADEPAPASAGSQHRPGPAAAGGGSAGTTPRQTPGFAPAAAGGGSAGSTPRQTPAFSLAPGFAPAAAGGRVFGTGAHDVGFGGYPLTHTSEVGAPFKPIPKAWLAAGDTHSVLYQAQKHGGTGKEKKELRAEIFNRKIDEIQTDDRREIFLAKVHKMTRIKLVTVLVQSDMQRGASPALDTATADGYGISLQAVHLLKPAVQNIKMGEFLSGAFPIDLILLKQTNSKRATALKVKLQTAAAELYKNLETLGVPLHTWSMELSKPSEKKAKWKNQQAIQKAISSYDDAAKELVGTLGSHYEGWHAVHTCKMDTTALLESLAERGWYDKALIEPLINDAMHGRVPDESADGYRDAIRALAELVQEQLLQVDPRFIFDDPMGGGGATTATFNRERGRKAKLNVAQLFIKCLLGNNATIASLELKNKKCQPEVFDGGAGDAFVLLYQANKAKIISLACENDNIHQLYRNDHSDNGRMVMREVENCRGAALRRAETARKNDAAGGGARNRLRRNNAIIVSLERENEDLKTTGCWEVLEGGGADTYVCWPYQTNKDTINKLKVQNNMIEQLQDETAEETRVGVKQCGVGFSTPAPTQLPWVVLGGSPVGPGFAPAAASEESLGPAPVRGGAPPDMGNYVVPTWAEPTMSPDQTDPPEPWLVLEMLGADFYKHHGIHPYGPGVLTEQGTEVVKHVIKLGKLRNEVFDYMLVGRLENARGKMHELFREYKRTVTFATKCLMGPLSERFLAGYNQPDGSSSSKRPDFDVFEEALGFANLGFRDEYKLEVANMINYPNNASAVRNALDNIIDNLWHVVVCCFDAPLSLHRAVNPAAHLLPPTGNIAAIDPLIARELAMLGKEEALGFEGPDGEMMKMPTQEELAANEHLIAQVIAEQGSFFADKELAVAANEHPIASQTISTPHLDEDVDWQEALLNRARRPDGQYGRQFRHTMMPSTLEIARQEKEDDEELLQEKEGAETELAAANKHLREMTLQEKDDNLFMERFDEEQRTAAENQYKELNEADDADEALASPVPDAESWLSREMALKEKEAAMANFVAEENDASGRWQKLGVANKHMVFDLAGGRKKEMTENDIDTGKLECNLGPAGSITAVPGWSAGATYTGGRK